MDAQYKADLRQLLEHLQPRSVLCLGDSCDSTVLEYVAAAPGRLAQHLAELPETPGRFDLVIVADLLERLDKTRGTRLLARLRDLHGGRFLLILPGGLQAEQSSPWDNNELLALGLILVGRYPATDGARYLYRFDLDDYKTTPDWLNSRFWAHPERWDKDFW
ncbi:MAG: DUF6231 family protein [Thiohalomonadaceae bacterium]